MKGKTNQVKVAEVKAEALEALEVTNKGRF